MFTDERKCHILADGVARSLVDPPPQSVDEPTGARRRPNSVSVLVDGEV
ncbi:hypothetical protein [Streptomyces sp. NBC_00069]